MMRSQIGLLRRPICRDQMIELLQQCNRAGYGPRTTTDGRTLVTPEDGGRG